MNKAMVAIGIIIMALLGIFAINMITSQQTGQELDYYLLKDTVEAAMDDAMDEKFYATNGVVRMDKEKFVENFVRRFADGVDASREYTISFYDLNETPPKASVKVVSNSNSINKSTKTPIEVKVSMISESNNKKDTWTTNYTSGTNITSSQGITVN
ncbi:MAG: hypothetical protein IKO49_08375 [Bacilli bacterium]|nr:hypothetical protein [Bacilli bacterium]